MVYGDSVYLYTGHDEASTSSTGFVMKDWHVFSSADMVNWKDNMIELDGDIHYLNLPSFTEAPYIHKYNDKYYLSYAASYPEQIHYAMSDSITGPWIYKGLLNHWKFTMHLWMKGQMWISGLIQVQQISYGSYLKRIREYTASKPGTVGYVWILTDCRLPMVPI